MFLSIKQYLIAGAVVLGVSGLAFGYHTWRVSSLETTISTQEAEIKKLTISNAKLEGAIVAKDANLDMMQREVSRLNSIAIEEAKARSAFENRLRSTEQKTRVDAIIASGGAQKLLNLENRYSRCQTENFGRLDGTCVNGVWVKTGERYDETVRGNNAR